jgi:hypothetical protein
MVIISTSYADPENTGIAILTPPITSGLSCLQLFGIPGMKDVSDFHSPCTLIKASIKIKINPAEAGL